MLSKEFIDNLPHTDEKIIDKYIKSISKEIKSNIPLLGLQESRKQANLKYGKQWRERLIMKKIYKSSHPFGKMSYY